MNVITKFNNNQISSSSSPSSLVYYVDLLLLLELKSLSSMNPPSFFPLDCFLYCPLCVADSLTSLPASSFWHPATNTTKFFTT